MAIRAVPACLVAVVAVGLVADGGFGAPAGARADPSLETLVFRPLRSSRFRLLGRILPREWRTLSPA
jgi:hypothetical protein